MKKLDLNLNKTILNLILAIFLGGGFIFYFLPIRNASIFTILAVVLIIFFICMVVINKSYYSWYMTLKKSTKNLFLFFTLLFTLCVLISLKGDQSYLQDNGLATKLYVYLTAYITLYLIVLAIIRLLLSLKNNNPDKEVSKSRIIFYALPSLIIFSIYLLGFSPGIMTYDSLFQWSQIQTNQYNDWHPVTHTWFMKLITLIWNNPAAICIAQIIIMSFVFGYGMYRFEKAGIKRPIIYLVTAAFALMPLNGIFAVTLWKDILFSTSVMFLTIVLFNIVSTNGKWLNKPSSYLIFFLASAGMVFFRHNGFAAFVATIVIFFAIYRLKLTKMYIIALIIIALHFIITGPVYKYFKVVPSDPNEAYSVPIQQIGSVIAYNGNITKQQLEFYNNVLPIAEWKKYDPLYADALKGNPKYNRSFLYAHKSQFFKYWLELCKQNPKITIRSYATLTSLIWRIYYPPGGYYFLFSTDPPTPAISKQYNIKPVYGNQEVKTVLSGGLIKSVHWFKPLYRPATFLYLIILFLFVMALKKNWMALLISLPALFNLGTIAAALPTQDLRYLYANILVAFILFLAAVINVKKRV